MPTYQYSCTECGHFFEQFQSFSDDALTECPVCGGRLRKVFNAVGVVFKGSGFYRNDSRDGAKSGSSAKSEGSGESKKSEGSGESKKSESTSSSPAASSGASSSEKKSSSGSTSGSSGSSGSGSSTS